MPYFNQKIFYNYLNRAPGRPTLVFVHGLSGSSSAWKLYEEQWRNQYNLLFFDLRGHGLSAKPAGYDSYRLELFADDINSMIKSLGLDRFVLVCHSFGVLIALEYLKKYHPSLSGLVLLSPNIEVRRRRLAGMAHFFLKHSRWLDFLPFPLPLGRQVDYADYKNTGDWNLRRMQADVGATSLRVYLWASAQAYTFNGSDFISNIKIPTLIMHGRQDTIFPVENAFLITKKIPHSELIIIDPADHILVLNQFDQVSAAISRFVDSL